MYLTKKDEYLTATEFFDKYFVKSSLMKIELHEGKVVCQPSPSLDCTDIASHLASKIRAYIVSNKRKCRVYTAPSVAKLDEDTVVIPELFVVCDRSKIENRKLCIGSPDFIIEVISFNSKDDYYAKRNLYYENGVREYWIINPEKELVLTYFFNESFKPELYDFNDDIPVNIYNGELTLNINKDVDWI